MLDLIKMTVSLTVSSSLPSKNFMFDKDLAAKLIIEWGTIETPTAYGRRDGEPLRLRPTAAEFRPDSVRAIA